MHVVVDVDAHAFVVRAARRSYAAGLRRSVALLGRRRALPPCGAGRSAACRIHCGRRLVDGADTFAAVSPMSPTAVQTQRAERDRHRGSVRAPSVSTARSGNPRPQRAERAAGDDGGHPNTTQPRPKTVAVAAPQQRVRAPPIRRCPGQQDDAACRVLVRIMIGRGYHQPAGEIDDYADPPEQCGDDEHEPQPVGAKAPDVRQPCADPAEQPALTGADDPRRGLLLLPGLVISTIVDQRRTLG